MFNKFSLSTSGSHFILQTAIVCAPLVDSLQSELPLPIPRNSVESDHGCTSRIYFDNTGDNLMLVLYKVTLTSQIPCQHNNNCYSAD